MSLKEKLLKYDAKELIFVAEPHSDFTDEAKKDLQEKDFYDLISKTKEKLANHYTKVENNIKSENTEILKITFPDVLSIQSANNSLPSAVALLNQTCSP